MQKIIKKSTLSIVLISKKRVDIINPPPPSHNKSTKSTPIKTKVNKKGKETEKIDK